MIARAAIAKESGAKTERVLPFCPDAP